MDSINEMYLVLIIYSAICFRWYCVINKYQKDVLIADDTYEYKDHPVFKGILFLRALGLAIIAPVVSLMIPKYLNTFFDGVEITGNVIDAPQIVRRTTE